MNPAFCEKEMIEIMCRQTLGGFKQIKPQGRFRNHSASSHHTITSMLCLLWLFSVSNTAVGQIAGDSSQTPLPPGIDIQAKALPEIATIGDPLQIDLDITMPEGYQVQILEPESQMGDFTILDFFPGPIVVESETPQDSMPAGTTQHHRARIVAAVYKTGKFIFPSLPIGLRTPDGEEIALSSPPINIEIQSVLIDEKPKLKDLKKQAEISESVPWLLWLAISLAAALLGAIIWYYWRKRRKRPISYSPEQIRNLLDIAESDLKELLSRGLPKNGMVKKFYVLLSEIVKRILESGYEIHAVEQTTSEIMDSVHRTSSLEGENRERIESFLASCDVVKFAKYVPSMAEHEAVANDALQILEEAKKAVASRQSPVASEQ